MRDRGCVVFCPLGRNAANITAQTDAIIQADYTTLASDFKLDIDG